MFLSKDFILGCCKSWFDITRCIIFRKKKLVIFAAPQHFNRDCNGKNPYFAKLIAICKDNNLPYLVLESPEYDAPQPHDTDSVRADLLFWGEMLLNKIALKIYGTSNQQMARKAVSKVMNCLTLGKLKVDCYISMAGLFIEMFGDMNPDGIVYDLQHGVIYAGHDGYFKSDGGVSESLSADNCKILLWGEGYKELFTHSDKIKDDKVRVIGYPVEQSERPKTNEGRNTILFSLQFTASVDYDTLEYMKTMLDKALSSIDFNRYTVKLKHHPRYNNVISLDDISKKYPNISYCDDSLEDMVKECLLHVTWFSTTCFEYAKYGIPTYILSDSRSTLGNEIYYFQFKYPVLKGLSLEEVLKLLNDPIKSEEISVRVREWYLKLYSPFNEKTAKSILGIDDTKN